MNPIDATAIYRPTEVMELFDVSKNTLKREVRLGRLRVSRIGGKNLFLGARLLEWIERAEVVQRPRVANEQERKAM
jgi:predicted site-specific integrase-resolvase